MELLLVSATPLEIQPLLAFLEKNYVRHRPYQYQQGDLSVHVLITGVGMASTAFALGRLLSNHAYDLAINVGIAGCFRPDWPLGRVVQVISERFGDLGVEEADGRFTSVFELGLTDGQAAPFREGLLVNEGAGAFGFLPKAHGLTVSRVHGSASSIAQITQAFPEAEVESMEGAAFFYACLLEEVPFLAIRAVSNYVEPRNRDNWEVGLAVKNLNETVQELLQVLAGG